VKWVGCRPLQLPGISLLTLIYVIISYPNVGDFAIVIILPLPARAASAGSFSFLFINTGYSLDVGLSYLLEELQRTSITVDFRRMSTISDLANLEMNYVLFVFRYLLWSGDIISTLPAFCAANVFDVSLHRSSCSILARPIFCLDRLIQKKNSMIIASIYVY
jgi:hypothetical protein